MRFKSKGWMCGTDGSQKTAPCHALLRSSGPFKPQSQAHLVAAGCGRAEPLGWMGVGLPEVVAAEGAGVGDTVGI